MELAISLIVPLSYAVLPIQVEEWHDESLAELESLSGTMRAPSGFEQDAPVRFRRLRPGESPRVEALRPGLPHRSTITEFTFSVETDIDQYQRMLFANNPRLDDLDEALAVAFAKDYLSVNAAVFVADLLLAANIARPGSLQASGMYRVENDDILRVYDGQSNYFAESVQLGEQYTWPVFTNSTIATVLEWFREIPGMHEGTPEGAPGRAVAAVSHLNSESTTDSAVRLYWSLVGLEALYCEGGQSLRQQIIGKTELVFGNPPLQYKRRIRRLYDVRSALVHGGLDLGLAYWPFSPARAHSHDDLNTAAELAEALLLASLQKLVMHRSYSFEFDYVWRPAQQAE